MQRALSIERPAMSSEDAELIALIATDTTSELLADLPSEPRDAVTAHVLQDRGYAELAEASDTSEAAMRQRVSRGLTTLRRRIGSRP
jgi:RNA polymerase sigma-70 factor (ECF subfamily)